MSDFIQNKIKEDYEKAETPLKKAGVIAGVAGVAPVVAAAVVGEKAAGAAVQIADKAKKWNKAALMKKYNPLFPSVYESESFSVPNMLMIVDDAVRKDIEICKGSMGWTSRQNGMEVLHLYDTAIGLSKLSFIPHPACDTIYYIDPHNSHQYISIDSLFDTFQKQKIAELANVAYCLGARSYSVEIVEEETASHKISAGGSNKGKVLFVDADNTHSADMNHENKIKRRAFTSEEYEERREPIVPELSWFKNEDNITGLIDQVCNGTGTIKSKVLVFEGSKYAGMSKSIASKIDVTVKKMGAAVSANVLEKAEHEYVSKMIFKIDF